MDTPAHRVVTRDLDFDDEYHDHNASQSDDQDDVDVIF